MNPNGSLPPIRRSLLKGFMAYTRIYLRRHFHALRMSMADRPDIGEREPLLVYMNHPSWWDPLVAMWLAYHLFPEREHYGPIDAAALERYPFLRHLGLVGVEQGTAAGARAFLRQGGRAAGSPQRGFWVTAQGRFSDPRERPLGFAPGLGHLASRMERGVILPLAIEYPFWEERLPEAVVRFGVPVRVEREWERSAEEWTRLLEQRLVEAQEALSADTVARRADRFETLLGGSAGVGGVYDAWRRLKASLAGRAFDPEHGTIPR